MNTILTLHLVNIQPVFIFFIFLAGCLVAVSWMLVIKSSRYKELQEDYYNAKYGFQKDIADLRLEFAIDINKLKRKHIAEIGTIKTEHVDALAKCQATSDAWRGSFHSLKASLPKPRERAHDGKFVKGSSRLDNLRKHLLEGNRTDRFTAQESFGIAHVSKFISTLKKEGFDIRKEKRKIAKDSFLTEYYLVPEKKAREWTPMGNYEGIHESLVG